MTFGGGQPLLPDEDERTEESQLGIVRHTIKQILLSYNTSYDCLAELIQNSVDAIDDQWRVEDQRPRFKGTVIVKVDLRTDTICVIDNGTGIAEDEWKKFFRPFATNKMDDLLDAVSSRRGYKGVGATFLSYAFKGVQVSTKNGSSQWSGKMMGGRDWIEDPDNHQAPEVSEYRETDADFRDFDRGTLVRIFLGTTQRPKKASNFGGQGKSVDKERWNMILRTRTAIGRVSFKNSFPFKMECKLRIKHRSSSRYTPFHNVECAFPFLHKHNASLTTGKFLDLKRYLPLATADISRRYLNKKGMYSYWSSQEIVNLIEDASPNSYFLTDDVDRSELKNEVTDRNIEFYSILCNSNSILADNSESPPSGYFVASKQMILKAPETPTFRANTHLVQQTLSILSIDGVQTDLGRKSFSDGFVKVLAGFLCNFAQGYFTKGRRHHIHLAVSRRRSTEAEGTEGATSEDQDEALVRRMKIKEEIERATLPHYPDHHKVLLEPSNEQDVVSMFNQLISKESLPGFSLARSYTTEWTYDSIQKYEHNNEDEIFKYSDENMLGLTNDVLLSSSSLPIIIEFKYGLSSLIENIVENTKKIEDMQLVVAWDEGQYLRDGVMLNFRINQCMYEGMHAERKFFGQTHTLVGPDGKTLPIILLKYCLDVMNGDDNLYHFVMDNHDPEHAS